MKAAAALGSASVMLPMLTACASSGVAAPTVTTMAATVPAPMTATAAAEPSSPSGGWIAADFTTAFETEATSLGADASIGISDLAGGPVVTAGEAGVSYAYSTIKVALAATLLRLIGDEPSDEQQAAVTMALTASDNAAARDIYDWIIELTGSEEAATGAIEATLATAGDSTTQVPTQNEIADWSERQAAGVLSTYGQTRWTTGDQARFVAQLLRGCLTTPTQTDQLRTAMSSVVPGQSWGLGQVAGVGPFKGGWGQDESGGGYYVRQVGEVTGAEGGPFVVAIAVHLDPPSPVAGGSVAAEASIIEQLGTWAVDQLGAAPVAQSCEPVNEAR